MLSGSPGLGPALVNPFRWMEEEEAHITYFGWVLRFYSLFFLFSLSFMFSLRFTHTYTYLVIIF